MDNSTKQLRSFQVVEELVISNLVHLKRRTKTLINSYLKRIARIITIVSQSYFTFGLALKRILLTCNPLRGFQSSISNDDAHAPWRKVSALHGLQCLVLVKIILVNQ